MRRLVCAVLLTTFILANLAGAATKYTIKDLGTLPASEESYAYAVNTKGQVVGTSRISPAAFKPFLWQNGRMTELNLPGDRSADVNADINDSGQILVNTSDEAFIIQGDSAKRIQGLPGYPSVHALAMNNRMDVVGRCTDSKGIQRPFFRRNGIMMALPLPPKCTVVWSVALNQNGVAVGRVGQYEESAYNVLWKNWKLQVLDGLGDSFFVQGISDDGTVVGGRSKGNQDSAFVWRSGKVTYLRPPEGMISATASCVNAKAEVAGLATTDSRHHHAVVWDSEGLPTDLGTLGGPLSYAMDINDAGVVVGMSTDKEGHFHAVMWTPVK